MIKELGELNEQIYKLYGRLNANKSLLALMPDQIKYIATVLFTQYKAEYKLLLLRSEISEKRALYDAEVRHYNLVPRKRFFFFRNRAMKQLDQQIGEELLAWFEKGDVDDLPIKWRGQDQGECSVSADASPERESVKEKCAELKESGPSAQAAAKRTKKSEAPGEVPGQLSLLNV